MKNTKLIRILLTLCIFLVVILLMKELNLYHLFENIMAFVKVVVISISFVLFFEPLIEKVPFSTRSLQCILIYVGLAVVLMVCAVLLIPVITDQWDKIVTLLNKIKNMTPVESEMTFQVEKAMSGLWPFVQQLKDIGLSYMLAFFLSLEFDKMTIQSFHHSFLSGFMEQYQSVKDVIYQYLKAMMIDLIFLFAGQSILLGLFQVESFVSLALFLAVMNVIPYFGATVAQIFIFLVDTLHYGRVRLGMIVCVFVFQQIESNCLQPFLYGHMMNLKPWVMLISILFFGSVFGIMGVLFAPILAVSIQVVTNVKKSS